MERIPSIADTMAAYNITDEQWDSLSREICVALRQSLLMRRTLRRCVSGLNVFQISEIAQHALDWDGEG